jgi:hypothetical protein
MALRFIRILSVLSLFISIFTLQAVHASSIPLPQTGQTGCWDVSGNSIVCATNPLANGQDGKLKKGVAAPVPRFTNNSNGTVTDNQTGLVWLKNANCFGAQSWPDALNSANTLVGNSTQCSLSDGSVAGDWRLPNITELESLVDLQNTNPALPSGHPFDDVLTPTYWWSSTTASDAPGSAFVVLIGTARVYSGPKNITSLKATWPVR